MDESGLLKAFERLRSREGLSLARVRAESDLMAYLGCDDEGEAQKRLVHVAGSIDQESRRLAVLAELGVGFTGLTLDARRKTLTEHYEARGVTKGVERIRQESRDGFKELAALVAKLHKEGTSRNDYHYYSVRVSNNSFLTRTEFGSRVILGTLKEEGDDAFAELPFSLEKRRDNAWLVAASYAEKCLMVDIFEADLSTSVSPVEFRHQAGSVFTIGEGQPLTADMSLVNIKIKLPPSKDVDIDDLYYGQLSNGQPGWQRSSIIPLAEEGASLVDLPLFYGNDEEFALFAPTQTKLIQCHTNEIIYGPGSFIWEARQLVEWAKDRAKAETQRKLEELAEVKPSTESQLVQD